MPISACEEKPLAIAIMGPTASGKTALGIALARHLNTEIISVDSALVFKGLDIGSAKPSSSELAQAPHRLIDLRDPSESYSAAEFCKDAAREMQALQAEGKTPILVGGTMLYFKSLLEGLADMPSTAPEIRAQVDAEAEALGWPEMHKKLAEIDPECAAKLHPNHSQRIGRALEVFRMTGKTMTEWRKNTTTGLKGEYNWLQIAIAPRDRSILHGRIEKRFEQMLADGFVEEVKALYERGDLTAENPAIRAVGYRQVWHYLEGKISYAEMIDKGVAATRQLAKRQFTWLRSWPSLNWVYTENENGVALTSDQIVENALNFLPKRTI